jgi:hypothetical protein
VEFRAGRQDQLGYVNGCRVSGRRGCDAPGDALRCAEVPAEQLRLDGPWRAQEGSHCGSAIFKRESDMSPAQRNGATRCGERQTLPM